MTLHASQTPAPDPDPAKTTARVPAPAPAVLVISDDPGFREQIRHIVAAGLPDARVSDAGSLHAAKEAAEAGMPDAVLLDIDLPGASGLSPLISAQAILPPLPIVLLAQDQTADFAVDAVRRGASDVIAKGTLATCGLPLRIAFAIERSQARQKIQRTNAFLRGLVATIGHDLRAPPRQICMLLDMIEAEETALVPALRKQLKLIRGRAEDLRKLLNATLSYARQATLAPDCELLSLSGVMETVGADFDPVDANRISVAGDATFVADPNLAYLVLRNLVENGLKYWRRVPSRVTVRGIRGEGHTRIEVADTGFGMSETVIARAFDPATRGVDGEEFDGTGFGLSIVRLLVEAHEGRIDLTSEPGKGTRVCLWLPDGPGIRPAIDGPHGTAHPLPFPTDSTKDQR